ncbi:MAG: PQQ-binding-like beta-propeller repeat protein [Treponema sp.]|nr:PQQ-binding-like beta-propeller repeat protein [Treponema sp.]
MYANQERKVQPGVFRIPKTLGILKPSSIPCITFSILLPFLFPWTIHPQAAGKSIWKQPLGGQVIGLPSVQAGSVAVVCEGGALKAYSRQGNSLWNYAAGGKLSPFITRSREGMNYVCRTNGRFIAVNRIGQELWQLDLGEPLVGPVLLGWDGRLFVPTNKKISCYTTAGNLLWDKNLESPIVISPREDKRGGIVTALDNGKLLQIDGFGKTIVTQLSQTPAILLSLAQPEDPISGKEIPILILYKDGTSEIIGGTQEYPSLPALAHPVGAASRNGKAAVTLKDGQVLLLSVTGGEILWTERSAIIPDEPGEMGNETAMIYDDRGIYMLSKSGAAGFTEQGQRLWYIRILGAAAIPIFSEEGLLYSGGSDWNLYAYRLENRILPRYQSLYGPPPAGAYGLGTPFPPRQDYTNRFSETELRFRFTRIDRALREGQVGEHEKEFTAYLMEAAASVRNSIRVSQTNPPVQIRQRIEATRLLSYLGSKEIIPFLADLFSHDPDPLVKAAAAEAIGRIGFDPDGLALEAFSLAVSPSGKIKDEQVLIAIAAAVGSLCRFSGPPVSGAGTAVLIALAGTGKSVRVRNRALEEIKSLQQ